MHISPPPLPLSIAKSPQLQRGGTYKSHFHECPIRDIFPGLSESAAVGVPQQNAASSQRQVSPQQGEGEGRCLDPLYPKRFPHPLSPNSAFRTLLWFSSTKLGERAFGRLNGRGFGRRPHAICVEFPMLSCCVAALSASAAATICRWTHTHTLECVHVSSFLLQMVATIVTGSMNNVPCATMT